MTIDEIIEGVVAREGSEFTNDPKDSGGATKFGITRDTLAKWRGSVVTSDDVRRLTVAEAKRIYLARYVIQPGFDTVSAVSIPIAEELIDTGVNVGPARAGEMLQRCLNALNREGRDYPDVKVDGNCGAGTIAAMRAFLKLRGHDGEIVLLRALNCLQGAFYISLTERRPKDESFLYGWLLNRVTG